ncbi:MAG: Pyrrolo-quinoline quinone [Verrucomicrobiales bacterium]|nr:Pyrrolo-quinoline quinone [Verrucomicrobiales bacterium]|tara:strand:- start:6669 stop:7958 length:1290 start_codon:yes stop_codon:yes gene_type:complete
MLSFVAMKVYPLSSFRLVAALISLNLTNLIAENWSNWRGPEHTGSREGEGYPTEWNPGSVKWKVALPGKGASVPVVHDGKIYVTTPDGGMDSVIAFDLFGQKVWETKFGEERPAKHKILGTSSNSSPVTDGDGLYVYFKSGTLASLEMDGTIRWKRNLANDFGSQDLYWDQGSSPVIVDKKLILPRLHAGDSWVAAFDLSTGEILWKTERNYDVPPENDNGYTTPVPIRHRDKDAVMIWCSDHVTTYAAKTGELLWSSSGFNPEGMKLWPHIATPVVIDDVAIIPVGRDDRKQASVHAIRLGGSGDVTKTHRLWDTDKFGVYVASPVAYGGRVYLLRHKGGLVAVDPETGKAHWEEAFPRAADAYYASPVIAGGILYAAREDGVVFAAKVGETFELLSENAMGEQILATPVAFGGKLLLRGENHLFCVE